ncbi:MAG: hypothetical protein WB561_17460 [Terracidiphilus sp.]
MSLVTNTTATETAIQEAANKLIKAAAEKNGLTFEQVPQAAKDDAYRFARESIESEAVLANNPSHQLYLQAKQENALLKAQLGAVRENRTAKADNRTVDTMERVRDTMGRATWFQLSRDQKVASLGVEPSSVDMVQLRTLFGKHTDTALAVDFAKTSPYRYKQLREVAKALDVTGK